MFDTDTENGLGAGTALTGVVGLNDILTVSGHFGQSGSASIDPLSDATGAGYHTRFGRGGRPPGPGTNPWDLRPPDGAIGLGDVLDASNQFGLNC